MVHLQLQIQLVHLLRKQLKFSKNNNSNNLHQKEEVHSKRVHQRAPLKLVVSAVINKRQLTENLKVRIKIRDHHRNKILNSNCNNNGNNKIRGRRYKFNNNENKNYFFSNNYNNSNMFKRLKNYQNWSNNNKYKVNKSKLL